MRARAMAVDAIDSDNGRVSNINLRTPRPSGSDSLKCTGCGADIPDVSRFCLSCGKAVPPPTSVPVQQAEEEDEPNFFAILLLLLAFMVFFFALVPMFLGLWIGVGIMAGVGMLMVGAGLYMIRSHKREVKEAAEKASVKIKCRYCGSLNPQDAQRCMSCGATL